MPSQGDCWLIPVQREYALHFRGFSRPAAVTVNGTAAAFSYDAKTHTVSVTVDAAATDGFTVTLTAEDLRNRNEDVLDRAVDILKRSQIGMDFKQQVYQHLTAGYPTFDKLVSELNYCPRTPGERDTVWAVLEGYMLDRKYER